MTMIESVKTCLSKYATFSGRASRSEFWWFTLFWILVGSALSFIDSLVFAPATFDIGISSGDLELQYGFSNVFGLSVFIPLCAVFSRRLHDAGHSLVTGIATLLLPIPLLFLIMVVTIGLGFGDITLLGPDQSMFERIRGIVIFAMMVIPVLIPLVVLYWLVRRSENDANQFGPNPLEVTPCPSSSPSSPAFASTSPSRAARRGRRVIVCPPEHPALVLPKILARAYAAITLLRYLLIAKLPAPDSVHPANTKRATTIVTASCGFWPK